MMALVTFPLAACQTTQYSASPALPGRFHLFQNTISHTTAFNKALYTVEGDRIVTDTTFFSVKI